ncbi:MAG: hypothetical protein H6710_20840 [Myxococcales bacterium]|nr:hypothetical protein [Myxococcales bacterium]
MDGGFVAALERGIHPSLRADNDLRRRSLLAAGLAWCVALMGVVLAIIFVFVGEGPMRMIAVTNSLVFCGLAWFAVLMVKRGRLVLAGNWIAGIIAIGVAFALAIGGNVGAPFTVAAPLAPVLALVLGGRRSGIAWGVFTGLYVVSFAIADGMGIVFPDLNPPGGRLIVATVATIAALGVMLWLASFSESLKERAIREVEEAASRLDRALAEEEKAKIAAEQAIAANAAKGAFLATMSHELRTPLNVIMGYAELIEEELGGETLGDHVESLRRIRSSGEHLLGLISDILDLAKIEAERLELHPELFDVSALLHELGGTFEPLARKKDNRIMVVASEALPVYLDKTRVRQILVNLLGNAIKFTDEGIITLAAARHLEGERAWVDVTVSDTGIGIADDKLGSIFESFVQADSSFSRQHQGSGLGLAIVRKLCEMMGASISASSRLGTGTSIKVRLPVTGPALRGTNGGDA